MRDPSISGFLATQFVAVIASSEIIEGGVLVLGNLLIGDIEQ